MDLSAKAGRADPIEKGAQAGQADRAVLSVKADRVDLLEKGVQEDQDGRDWHVEAGERSFRKQSVWVGLLLVNSVAEWTWQAAELWRVGFC